MNTAASTTPVRLHHNIFTHRDWRRRFRRLRRSLDDLRFVARRKLRRYRYWLCLFYYDLAHRLGARWVLIVRRRRFDRRRVRRQRGARECQADEGTGGNTAACFRAR